MKRFTLIACLFSAFSATSLAQVNINGKLDAIEEFSTIVTVKVEMPDGIKLSTDVFIPVLQDSLVVTIPKSSIPLVGSLLGSGDVSIELIQKGTQLFIYDSIWDPVQNMRIVNPKPYQLPMVFTRTPYGKNGDVVGRIVSIMGYAYALQDMRGRYESEGVYFPMYSDSWSKNPYHANYAHILDVTQLTDPKNSNRHEDGYNSVNFLVNNLTRDYDFNADGIIDTTELFCNGSLGMFGASALGNTQYQAAAAHKINPDGPGLKSLLPIVATNEHYRFTGYQNGVFRERIVTGWLKGQIFDVEDELINTDTLIHDAVHTSADYGLRNQFDAASQAIDHFVEIQYNGGPAGYYPNSVGRADMDASAAPVDANGDGVANGTHSRYENMEVPAYHLTGWWDIFTDGQIETYNQMMLNLTDTYQNKQKQKLVIGPWAHQTIGSTKTGDMEYDENVADIIGINVGDIDINELDVNKVVGSEIISWFRYTLNYNNYKNIGLPTAMIPASQKWQEIGNLAGSPISVRVPSQDYKMQFKDLLNLLLGKQDLNGLKFEIRNGSIQQEVTIDLAAEDIFDGPLLPEFGGDAIGSAIDSINFMNVPNVRYYVVGPNNDGVAENTGVGNYWKSDTKFPSTDGIQMQDLFLHQDGELNFTPPGSDEGYRMYVHDPNDPLLTHGGANMIVKTPDGNHDSQGQMDFTDPLYRSQVMDRTGILQYTGEVIQDSLCIIGFPTVKLYAKTNPGGASEGPTDTDWFIRILDVYPDGREFFVVEGCVNARARDYARHLAEKGPYDAENPNVPYSNINIGELYEYYFKMMPIAYTWGKGHKMKVLVSSSNYNRYQVNPNLPIHDGAFFRRQPGDGQTYNYNGVDMEPRIAVQRVAHSPEYPTHISLPVYNKDWTGITPTVAMEMGLEMMVYPNPADGEVNVFMSREDNYTVSVINSLGQVIRTDEFADFIRINTSNLEKGMYFIEVRDAKGENRIVKKVSVL